MRLLAILAVLITTAVLLPGVSADKLQRGGAGQACMPGKKCNAGLTCDTASNKCTALTPVGGASAVQSKLGQACSASNVCTPDICGPGGVCIVAGKIGEACTTNSCAFGLSCSGGVCVATPAAGSEGSSCTTDSTCRQPDLRCGATNTCVKR